MIRALRTISLAKLRAQSPSQLTNSHVPTHPEMSTPAQPPPPSQNNVTRPENLGSSSKRSRGPPLYQHLLPLSPAPPSFLASFASRLPGLNLTAPQISAVYDQLTKTVWVTDQDEMVLLWRRGFFGKGNLSRSDPSWRQRVQNKRAELDGKEKREWSHGWTVSACG